MTERLFPSSQYLNKIKANKEKPGGANKVNEDENNEDDIEHLNKDDDLQAAETSALILKKLKVTPVQVLDPELSSYLTCDAYAKPMSAICPSIDAFWFERRSHKVHFFQFTVSKVHGYKTDGVRQAMDALRAIDSKCSFTLYLVVPAEIYDAVKFQRYEVGDQVDLTVDDEILNIPQLKLRLPFDKEEYKEFLNARVRLLTLNAI